MKWSGSTRLSGTSCPTSPHWAGRPLGDSIGVRSRLCGELVWKRGQKLTSGRSGNHRLRGWLLTAGAGIAPGAAPAASTLDLVPSIFHVLGAALPPEIAARPFAPLLGPQRASAWSAAGRAAAAQSRRGGLVAAPAARGRRSGRLRPARPAAMLPQPGSARTERPQAPSPARGVRTSARSARDPRRARPERQLRPRHRPSRSGWREPHPRHRNPAPGPSTAAWPPPSPQGSPERHDLPWTPRSARRSTPEASRRRNLAPPPAPP